MKSMGVHVFQKTEVTPTRITGAVNNRFRVPSSGFRVPGSRFEERFEDKLKITLRIWG
jgi:hypothetical protein